MDQLKKSLSSHIEYKNKTEDLVATMKQRLSEEHAKANRLVCSPMVSVEQWFNISTQQITCLKGVLLSISVEYHVTLSSIA